MNQKQAKAYIESEGNVCPFCGGEEWDSQGVDVEDGFAYQEVTCLKCNQEWVDAYKLHHVVELH